MRRIKILLVDDEPDRPRLLQNLLAGSQFEVSISQDEHAASALLKTQNFDLSIVDLHHKGNGIACMERLHELASGLPIIIVADNGSISTAVEAIHKGAFTFIPKPFDPKELVFIINQACRKSPTKAKSGLRHPQTTRHNNGHGLIGKSKSMAEVLETIERISYSDSTVAIYGASGTGKEMVARAIQQTSHRRNNKFIAVNCGAIPEHLLESELFGHTKGAFTSASSNSVGLFPQANKGTIFLDEIGELPLALQTKLLRVIQERRVRPVGSLDFIDLDIRIIIATNKNLEKEVKSGRFREDLFYRIHVIPIVLPLLKDRKEDIPLLAEHFMKKYSRQARIRYKPLSRSTLDRLIQYDWPGNIRELENLFERVVALHNNGKIHEDSILPHTETAQSSLSTLTDARNQFERRYLDNLLAHTRGNITKASKIAGRYRADLYNMMRKHNLSPLDYKTR